MVLLFVWYNVTIIGGKLASSINALAHERIVSKL